MSSFYDVTSGATTNAADVNQYADRLNATTGVQVKLISITAASSALQGMLPSAPASDQNVLESFISGDANVRVATYIRAADGYGGIRGGPGSSVATAHLYAQANGWRTDESLAIGGALNVTGSTTLAGLNAGAISASGGVTSAQLVDAQKGLYAYPFGNDDAIALFDRNGVYSANIGYGPSGGGGFYIYDVLHGNFIISGGTGTGITFSGTVTAGQYQGPIAIDVESSQTVIRTGVGAINIVLQVNGHNWVFRNDGKLITPSGATIS